mgnify:CR=1 FL=1
MPSIITVRLPNAFKYRDKVTTKSGVLMGWIMGRHWCSSALVLIVVDYDVFVASFPSFHVLHCLSPNRDICTSFMCGASRGVEW